MPDDKHALWQTCMHLLRDSDSQTVWWWCIYMMLYLHSSSARHGTFPWQIESRPVKWWGSHDHDGCKLVMTIKGREPRYFTPPSFWWLWPDTGNRDWRWCIFVFAKIKGMWYQRDVVSKEASDVAIQGRPVTSWRYPRWHPWRYPFLHVVPIKVFCTELTIQTPNIGCAARATRLGRQRHTISSLALACHYMFQCWRVITCFRLQCFLYKHRWIWPSAAAHDA